MDQILTLTPKKVARRLNLGASHAVVESRRVRLLSPPDYWPPAPVTAPDLTFQLPTTATMQEAQEPPKRLDLK